MHFIGNTLWVKRTVLMCLAITPPKVNLFGWNLEQCKPNVRAGCGRFWARAVATVWEGAEIFFVMRITHDFTSFPSGKFYDIWTQHCRLVSPCKLSEQNFENVNIRGRFSKKTRKLLTKFPRRATSGHPNSAVITDAENSLPIDPPMGCLVSIFTVRINTYKVFPLGCTLRTGSQSQTFLRFS